MGDNAPVFQLTRPTIVEDFGGIKNKTGSKFGRKHTNVPKSYTRLTQSEKQEFEEHFFEESNEPAPSKKNSRMKGKKSNTSVSVTRKPSAENSKTVLPSTSSVVEKTAEKIRKSLTMPMNSLVEGGQKEYLRINKDVLNVNYLVIHPYSNFRLVWDILTAFLHLVNVAIVPVIVTFVEKEKNAMVIVKYFSDVWFIVDMYLSFHTGIVIDGPDSEIEMNPEKISKLYTQWRLFWVDLVSTIFRNQSFNPFDVILIDCIYLYNKSNNFLHMGEPLELSIRVIKISKLIALLRICRLTKFVRTLKTWEDVINFQLDFASILCRFLNISLILLTGLHIATCLQYLVPMFFYDPQGDNSLFEDTWVYIRGMRTKPEYDGILPKYVWALFRAISHMVCIGYGKLNPCGTIDLAVTIITTIVGAFLFAFFIGSITSIVQSRTISQRQYKEKIMQVKEYMSFRKFPMELRHRMDDYYENRYQGKMFHEQEILAELNPVLREELINHNCCELIDMVPFFKNADADFLSNIIGCLKFEVYLNGDRIINQGTIGDRMYFISRGSVLIRHNKETEKSGKRKTMTNIEQRLSDGAYFGEICLLANNIKRVASVYADSQVNCYALERHDFERVLEHHPGTKQQIQKLAKVRMLNNKMLSERTEFLDKPSWAPSSIDEEEEKDKISE